MNQQEIDFSEPSASKILIGFSGTLCLSNAQETEVLSKKQKNNMCAASDVECALTFSTSIWNTNIQPQLKPLMVLEQILNHSTETIKDFVINQNVTTINQHIKVKSGLFPDYNNNICALVNVSGIHFSWAEWDNFRSIWKTKITNEILTNKNSFLSPSLFLSKSFDQWALQDLGTEKNIYAKQLIDVYKKKFA